MTIDLRRWKQETDAYPGDTPEERWFRWLEGRLVTAGEPPIPWWWEQELVRFWKSGKRVFYGGVGLRGLKSSVTTRASISAALFRDRRSVMGGMLVLPILSALKVEGGGRIANIRSILRSLGFRERERKGKGEEAAEVVPPGEYTYSLNASSGLGIIDFRDASDNMVTCWVRVAGLGGVREYTGIGAIFDEWDHVPVVGDDGREPQYGGAHKILDYGIARMTGQDGAQAFVVSNPTTETACLSAACIAGDGHQSHIARLGDRGAEELERAFATLVAFLKWSGDDDLARDERLNERQDPLAWRIPSCIGHAEPSVAIIEHWKQSCDSARRSGEIDRMGTFFRIYCARAVGGEGANYIDSIISRENGQAGRWNEATLGEL